MRKYLLPKEGKFYKANLHMHTTVSDGQMTPEETKQAFMEKGYSIVAFTDHEVMVPHPELEDENFLPITSTEISIDKELKRGLSYYYRRTYHMNLYSSDKNKTDFAYFGANRLGGNACAFIRPEQSEKYIEHKYCVKYINKMIADCKKEGFLVSYNHPVWSGQDYADYIDLKGVWGVEWYNTGSALQGYLETSQPIEDLTRKGEFVVPLATDDAHFPHQCFGGWNVIKAEKLDYDCVFNAMKNGDLYSSTGPEIKELYIEDGVVHVEISEADAVFLTTERGWTSNKHSKDGDSLTSVDFDINAYLKDTHFGESKCEPYFRIIVQDKYGKLAYTRAYKISEIYDNKWVEKE